MPVNSKDIDDHLPGTQFSIIKPFSVHFLPPMLHFLYCPNSPTSLPVVKEGHFPFLPLFPFKHCVL